MSSLSERAAQALASGYQRCRPGEPLDGKGYARSAEANLLGSVRLDDIRQDFEQGAGNELKGKFLAAHSSSALAANCFGPFKTRPANLELAGASGFARLDFERKCPTGLRGTSPNLDVVAEADGSVLGIESKCTEYLVPHEARFADAYFDRIRDERRASPWFAEMERLQEEPRFYGHLDAAQLVKHAFGLARTFPGRAIMLFYLYWEPANPSAEPAFARHRFEIEDFSGRVKGAFPRFASLSYPELWRSWRGLKQPGWLAAHVADLERRYLVEM